MKPTPEKARKYIALALPMAVFVTALALVPNEPASKGADGVVPQLQGGAFLAYGGGIGGKRRLSFHRRSKSDAKNEPRYVKATSSKQLKYVDVSPDKKKGGLFSRRAEITVAKSSANYDKVRLGQRKPSWKYLTADVRRQIDAAHIDKGRWRYIVVHESATTKGNAKAFDNYHRNVKGMPNGLAYHFVIGNGSYTKNGQIEVGNRWTRQLQGGHLKSLAQNEIALGICLVGDFDSNRVNNDQMAAMDELVTYLQAKVGKAIVTTHRRINIVPTSCPGRYFPDTMVMMAYNK
jgi:hypothetical protein